MKTSESFRQKVLQLQGNLFSFAYQLTNDRDEANDLLQDTTLKALNNQQKFIENTNFKGWIFTIMRNLFINNYRQQIRQATVIDHTEDLYHLNLPQDSGLSTPEDSYELKEIMEVLNSLSDEFRTPFNMHISGYKYSEISKKLNIPLGTIKSRIFFARKHLRAQLPSYAEGRINRNDLDS